MLSLALASCTIDQPAILCLRDAYILAERQDKLYAFEMWLVARLYASLTAHHI